MFDLDQWQEIAASLGKNPLRTFLTALGVFWGIFMLVLMMGAGNGLERGATSEFRGAATNSFFIWAQRATMAYQGMQPNRSLSMTQQDYQVLQERLTDAEYIAARNQLGGYRGSGSVYRGEKFGSFDISGDYPQTQAIENFSIDRGRFINKLDLEEKRKVAVIGKRVVELLFDPGEDPIGENIRIRGVLFKVVGTFHTESSGDRGVGMVEKIFLPFTTFNQAFNYGNRVGWLSVVAKPDVPVSEVEEQALSILKARHKVHPDDERAFGHWNMEKMFQRINSIFVGIRFISWIVGILTLLAGAVGISNIMLVVVKERTKEIGVRRAIGAKPWQIMQQIVLEAVALTIMAGYGGLVLGLAILELIGWAMETFQTDTGMFGTPYVQFELAVVALIVLIISGILAGLIPASRAVSIRPVDALRAE